MTDLLRELHHAFGLLYVTVATMEQARAAWAEKLGPIQTDEELRQVKFGDDEPVLIVRALDGSPGDFREAANEDLNLLVNDLRGMPRAAKVLELPLDEFFYLKAFRTGIAGLAREMPDFFIGMTLVHAWGLFENYIGCLLLRILLSRPEMLGRDKHVHVGDLIDHATKETLLASVAEDQVKGLLHKPTTEWLKALRARYGLKCPSREHDSKIIETALVRNCLVHNRGLADDKLEKQSPGKYKKGVQIALNQQLVLSTTDVLRDFANTVDAVALKVHLTNDKSQ